MHIINPYRYAAAGGGGIPVVEAFTDTTVTSGDPVLTAPAGIVENDLLIIIGLSEGTPHALPSGFTEEIAEGTSGITLRVF